MRFNNFKNIVINGYIGNELAMRNNQKIRNIFAEIITVLCQSPKRHGFDVIKINKETDYNLGQLSNRLKAPNTTYGDEIFRKEDPKEIYIATNELASLFILITFSKWIIEFVDAFFGLTQHSNNFCKYNLFLYFLIITHSQFITNVSINHNVFKVIKTHFNICR